MAHACLYVPTAPTSETTFSEEFSRVLGAHSRFKRIQFSEQAHFSNAALAVSGTPKRPRVHILQSADCQVAIAALGTWLPLPARTMVDTAWLLAKYREIGAHGLARQIQGIFAIFIIDRQRQCAHVITDRCGSLHVFHRKMADGTAVSTSSAALAACDNAKLDSVGLHEFIATGIVYEDRSLWESVKKIPPASVLTLRPNQIELEAYWRLEDIQPESLSLNDAVDAAYFSLVDVLKACPVADQPLVSDLTGGYDSRFLLAGLLGAKLSFATTVSGRPGDPDVVVARGIADTLGLQHTRREAASSLGAEDFFAALRMTDGEYNAFEYARILSIHRDSARSHCFSINGSFGELGRGYWWELLWPRLAASEPLDAAMLARRRFAAFKYDREIFSDAQKIDMPSHMTDVINRVLSPLTAMPNTTQMDCVYYRLRMHRWQGRIASSTNQLWPSFSPIGFAQVLDPIFSAKAASRFRSLLVRRIFALHAPKLASIPLEHGYPPTTANLFNLWRFAPLVSHYGHKVVAKLRSRAPNSHSSNVGSPLARDHESAKLLSTIDLSECLLAPRLLDCCGHFDADALRRFLDPDRALGSSRLEQWQRLVTAEMLVREVDKASQP